MRRFSLPERRNARRLEPGSPNDDLLSKHYLGSDQWYLWANRLFHDSN
jgi:hypothetical protein